jgi:hypothetical protein
VSQGAQVGFGNVMKRLLRGSGIIVGLFVGAIALGALVPWPLFGLEIDDARKSRRILVLSNPIHTDIAVPINDEVLRSFDFLLNDGVPLDAPEV